MVPRYKLGDEVQSVSEPGRIGAIVAICEVHAGIQWYRVNLGGGDRPKISEPDLRPYHIGDSPLDRLKAGKIDGYGEFQRLITCQRLKRDVPLDKNIYAFNASKTRFYPYQFKPLLKFLGSEKRRLLIADEVGLGKTIEAGLILTEVRARQTTYRVLVVCPANLTRKWQFEMENRFGYTLPIITSREFVDFLREYGEPPHAEKLNAIISYESIRQDVVLEQLEAVSPQFDLVIMDEAHHMRNFGRKQRKAGLLLGENADAMIMLTATPIHLGSENLFSLLNILDDGEFPDFMTVDNRMKSNEPIVKAQICMGQIPPNIEDAKVQLAGLSQSSWFYKDPRYLEIHEKIDTLGHEQRSASDERKYVVDIQRDLAEINLLGHVFTRTKKKEVHENFPVRKASSIPIPFSEIERQLYEAITDFVREETQRHAEYRVIDKWTLQMPQRRAASSIPAMVEFYRLNLGMGQNDESEDMGSGDQDEPFLFDDTIFRGARERLRKIIRVWPQKGLDSKYDTFISCLRNLRNKDGKHLKVMVFAFFKDTLKYLSQRLNEDGFKNIIISGDIRPDERTRRVDAFRENGDYEILLSSKVGSEGLDFQFCDTMFNYDLPWNPMEIEQRIGRLDRLGQKEKVIRIFNFFVSKTIEEVIYKRLYERIGIFERSIGELEMILGEVLASLEEEIFSRTLSKEEEEKLIEAKERIILARLEQIKKLEKEAARFIGTDQYFNDEVGMIQKKRRYVTGEQMRQFILDFIRISCPRTRMAYDESSRYWRMYPDDVLRATILKRKKSGELVRFFGAYDEGVSLTFESQVAFENPRIEFINVLHPLTQMIVEAFTEEGHLYSTAHHIVLRTDRVTPGLYFYFIFKLKINSARTQNTLEMILMDAVTGMIFAEDESEILMGEMIENGEERKETLFEIDQDKIEEAYHKIEQVFHERALVVRKESEKVNNIFCDRRIESINQSFNKQVLKKKEQVRKGENEGKKEQYLRMIRGRIQSLEAEWKQKIDEVERMRRIEVSYDQISAGIMETIRKKEK